MKNRTKPRKKLNAKQRRNLHDIFATCFRKGSLPAVMPVSVQMHQAIPKPQAVKIEAPGVGILGALMAVLGRRMGKGRR